MKFFIILSLSLLALPTFANSTEVCGQLKSYNKVTQGHFPIVTLQDGTAFPVILGQAEVPMIITSIASGLTVCFEEYQNSAGPVYGIASISK